MFRRSATGLLLAAMALASLPLGASAQSPAPASLQGVDWLLVRIAGSGVPFIDVPPGVGATLRVDGAKAGGNGGCNSWFSDVKVDGDAIVFGTVGSTLMACQEPNMSMEGAYLGWLDDVATWSISDGLLTLSDTGGAPLLVFTAGIPTAQLEGTDWRAASLLMDGLLTRVPGDVPVTLRLEDGRAGGVAACNTYSGGYSLDGASLLFGPLASTEMACEEPRMSIEAAFLEALGATTTQRLTGGQLELMDGAGTTLVVLAAAPLATSIEGTWKLAELVMGDMVALVQSDATVTFGADGSLTGSTGCNNLMSDYVVDAAAIKVAPVATTKMACIDEGAASIETALLAALESAATWAISPDGWLMLQGADGAPLAGFTPAAAG